MEVAVVLLLSPFRRTNIGTSIIVDPKKMCKDEKATRTAQIYPRGSKDRLDKSNQWSIRVILYQAALYF